MKRWSFILIIACLLLILGCSGKAESIPGEPDTTPPATEAPTSPTEPMPPTQTPPVQEEKASSLLLIQVNLRQQQIAAPSAERLEQMKTMGMRTEPINVQRIFIYLAEKLDASQVEELQGLGITLYLDSWIPPVGNHPYGFMLADMPVDKLSDMAGKDYVIRLETAEQQAFPQGGAGPDGGKTEPLQKIAPVE